MLELRNLSFQVTGEDSKTKGIIKDINLTLNDHTFTAITGPNGGGKSTLARLIMGIERPTSGSILFNGTDITNMSITERARLGISYGYTWILGKRLNLEASIGVGYAYTEFDVYECQTCGKYKGPSNKHYVGPTKLALNLIYMIK